MDSEEEPSSSCSMMYLPEIGGDYDSLESDYEVLEHISMEWPSQTVFKMDDSIILAPNPISETPTIVSLKFEDFFNCMNFSSEKVEVGDIVNRIKCSDKIYAVSDNALHVLDGNLDTVDKLEEKLSYGFDLGEYNIFSTVEGDLIILDHHQNEILRGRVHQGDINCLRIANNVVYTCSNDGQAKALDIRTFEEINIWDSKSEVNALDFKDNTLVFGADSGEVIITDIRKPEIIKTLNHHKAPMTSIKFYENNKFISTCDEAVFLWDYTEEKKKDEYVIFEHTGEKNYKEAEILQENYFVVTSEDGLCFFKPYLK